jgi:hypothetical protein
VLTFDELDELLLLTFDELDDELEDECPDELELLDDEE